MPRKTSFPRGCIVFAAVLLLAAARLPDTAAQPAEVLPSTLAENAAAAAAAATFRQAGQPVTARADGALVCEAEEFLPTGSGWQALPWGTNYYAATLANTHLSRKAYLGAPPQGEASATVEVEVPRPGRYLALVRYEAAYRFETQFRLRIEQQGRLLFDRLYGARANPKIWAFGKRVVPEVAWEWGAVENIVWEGHDAAVDLAAGRARLTLQVADQPQPAARRNVDLVLLTPNADDVLDRIERESYLPLDGLLTQEGDVFLRLVNHADGAECTLTLPPCTEHSPYWVHLRRWQPKTVSAAPGSSSEWVEVGSLLDSLNDGQWILTATPAEGLHYTVELAAKRADGSLAPLAAFETRAPRLELAYDANTRYSRRIRPLENVLYELVDWLRARPVQGRLPQRTLVYAYTFDPRPDNPRYTAARDEFLAMFGLALTTADPPRAASPPRGYIDVRGQSPAELESTARRLVAEGLAESIAVVSLGDEIGLAHPPADPAAFHAWAQQRGLKPSDLDPAAGEDWSRITYAPDAATAERLPALYYYSRLYQHEYGIAQQRALTEALRPHLPNAGIGANYSPHHGYAYLGEVHQWITLFRRGGMTMPWSEDWIFQVPVCSQQVNALLLDLFRAGLEGRPEGKIHMYVMPHWPGNTPASWRRLFYNNLGHGMKVVNLFEFRPVQAAYTENHCSLPETYLQVRTALHELGTFEDLVQDGQVRPGLAALWFSETGDIWHDHRPPLGANKRAMYVAIRQQQIPLDVVIDEDALDGTLNQYRVLYLCDPHVTRAASRALAQWVAAGGRLLATAGAGMFDEFNQPNTTLAELFGIEHSDLLAPEDQRVVYEKQDLPFVVPMDHATWQFGGQRYQLPVIGAKAEIRPTTADVVGTFSDGSPAVTRRSMGEGVAFYCAFLPGLTYFKPAIPLRPVDRGTTDEAMNHFLPTTVDRGAGALVAAPAAGLELPVECSKPLVEASLVESPHGLLVTLVNWTGQPVPNLRVRLRIPPPAGRAALATGGALRVAKDGEATVYQFDLDVADALVLRAP